MNKQERFDRMLYLMEYDSKEHSLSYVNEYKIMKPTDFDEGDDNLSEEKPEYSIDELLREDDPEITDKLNKSKPETPPEPATQQPAPEQNSYANIIKNIEQMVNNLNNKLDLFGNKIDKMDMEVDALREPTEQEKFDNMKNRSGVFNTRVSDYLNTSKINMDNFQTKMSEIPYMYTNADVKQSFTTPLLKNPIMYEGKKTKNK